jgi:hypothetical protein
MALRGDERAVTVQVGAIILFGFIIVALGVYQTTAVPAQNEAVEFDHSQAVQSQLGELRNGILGAGTTGRATPVSVTLGTGYPDRTFFVNPPPVSGSLQTVDLGGELTVVNATATDLEAADFWTGGNRTYPTAGLRYSPDYNVYQGAPTTVYESTVVYDRFDGANLTESDQRLVRGNTVTLVTLNGSLDERGSGSASVDPTALSAPATAFTVRNDSRNVSLVVPTELPAAAWRDLLAAELDDAPDDDDRKVLGVRSVADGVRIDLEPGTYELRLARVGVGGGTDPAATYLTAETTDVTADDDGRAKLVATARDRFGNPKSDAAVAFGGGTGDFEAEDGTDLSTPVRTDADGEATVWYNATGTLGGTAPAAYLNDSPDATLPAERTVGYEVTGGGGNGSGGSGFDAGSNVIVFKSASATGSGDPRGGVEYVLENTSSLDANITGIRLQYATEWEQNGIKDGPNAITSATLNGTTLQMPSDAVETGSAVFFDDPVTLTPGDNSLTMQFDETYAFGNNDAIAVSVTVYYEGGVTGLYTVYLFGSGGGP